MGIDAGGTFTDVALLDRVTGEVLQRAKVPTLHENIRLTLETALDSVAADPAPESISLASTLATNALVESRGGKTGLLLIGYPERNARNISSLPKRVVNGRHDVTGLEEEPLDEKAALEAGLKMADEGVGSIAISSYGGSRNAEHERCAQALLSEHLNLPVLAAADVTTALNCEVRAATAAANARLLPIIGRLVDSLLEAIQKRGWQSTVYLVKGDGTLMSPSEARERPVELVLSGPAAASLGARSMAGIERAIVVDMGGTTTDLSMVAEGCFLGSDGNALGDSRSVVRVGDHRLSLAIIRSRTIGLGGDSFLQKKRGQPLQIGPERAIPLVRLFKKHADLGNSWKEIESSGIATWEGLPPVEFFVYGLGEERLPDLHPQEKQILAALQEGPLSRPGLSAKIGYQRIGLLAVDRLLATGAIQRAALTPTDILHALGLYQDADPEPAIQALKIWAQRFGGEWRQIAERCRMAVGREMALALYNVGLWRIGREDIFPDSEMGLEIFNRFWSESDGADLVAQFRLACPVVAVGAPAQAWISPLASKLGTEVIVPQDASVAGAVGAARGRHEIRAEIEYRADTNGGYTVHGPNGRHDLEEADEARRLAKRLAFDFASERAEAAGMKSPQITVDSSEHKVESDGGGEIVVGGWARASATPGASPLLERN